MNKLLLFLVAAIVASAGAVRAETFYVDMFQASAVASPERFLATRVDAVDEHEGAAGPVGAEIAQGDALRGGVGRDRELL